LGVKHLIKIGCHLECKPSGNHLDLLVESLSTQITKIDPHEDIFLIYFHAGAGMYILCTIGHDDTF